MVRIEIIGTQIEDDRGLDYFAAAIPRVGDEIHIDRRWGTEWFHVISVAHHVKDDALVRVRVSVAVDPATRRAWDQQASERQQEQAQLAARRETRERAEYERLRQKFAPESEAG